MDEVLVRREQDEVAPDAELGEQRVVRADLHSGATEGASQIRGRNVIVAVRLNQRKCGELVDDLTLRRRTGETLQQLLKDEVGRDDRVRSLNRRLERMNVEE